MTQGERLSDIEYWQRLKPILGEALELQPHERGEYLDASCGDDAQLRADVERLIADEEGAPEDFLKAPDSGPKMRDWLGE